MDLFTAIIGLVALVTLASLACLLVGGVPDRKPATAPRRTGDFDVWPFF
jgi:hypothetical protein